MKKLLFFVFVSTLFFSCVSNGPFKHSAEGARVMIVSDNGEAVINVCQQVDLNENSLAGTIKPGEVVTVITKSAHSALVRMTDGNTGWIDIKYLKK
jgi:hypothetical protein